jgi:hypothetical protein
MNDAIAIQEAPQIHVRYNGTSIDVDQVELDIGVLSTDQQIRAAVANHLGIPAVKLAGFTIDKNAQTQHITLRPDAVFGLKKI